MYLPRSETSRQMSICTIQYGDSTIRYAIITKPDLVDDGTSQMETTVPVVEDEQKQMEWVLNESPSNEKRSNLSGCHEK